MPSFSSGVCVLLPLRELSLFEKNNCYIYDDMFQEKHLRWVSRSFEFSSLGTGNVKVRGLWYKYCTNIRPPKIGSDVEESVVWGETIILVWVEN